MRERSSNFLHADFDHIADLEDLRRTLDFARLRCARRPPGPREIINRDFSQDTLHCHDHTIAAYLSHDTFENVTFAKGAGHYCPDARVRLVVRPRAAQWPPVALPLIELAEAFLQGGGRNKLRGSGQGRVDLEPAFVHHGLAVLGHQALANAFHEIRREVISRQGTKRQRLRNGLGGLLGSNESLLGHSFEDHGLAPLGGLLVVVG